MDEVTLYTLNMLLATKRSRDDGRLYVVDVARALDEIDFDNRSRELRRWLSPGGACAEARALWEIGNAMRRAGCPWISGFWLLWGCGRHIECLRIVQHLCHQKSPLSAKKFAALKHMLFSASAICQRTVFDRNLSERTEFAYTEWPEFVHSRRLDQNTFEHVEELARASFGEGWESLREEAPTGIAREYGTVLSREVAKIPWIAYEHMANEIDGACAAFFDSNCPLSRFPCDDLVDSAAQLLSTTAKLTDASFQVVQDLIGQYIDNVCVIRNRRLEDFPHKELERLRSRDFAALIQLLWTNEPRYRETRGALLDQAGDAEGLFDSLKIDIAETDVPF